MVIHGLDNYRAAIAFRAAMVQRSFSAGGSAYLTRKIEEANENLSKVHNSDLGRRWYD